MRAAFVTGATGFLGRNLIPRLIEAGWTITALRREGADPGYHPSLPIRFIAGSLLDTAALMRGMPRDVDCVFHLAANTSMWALDADIQRHDNVEGTRNMVATALARGARRFVMTSTWNVYGLEQGDIHEGLEQHGAFSPINYDRTKWQAEQAVKVGIDRGLQAVILNPAHIIGRFDQRNWATLIRNAATGRLLGVPPGAGSFAHAAEVARAHVAAADLGRVGENYLLGGADATFLEFVSEIALQTGKAVPTRAASPFQVMMIAGIKDWVSRLTRRPPDLSPDSARILCASARVVSTKAFYELGYRSPPLADMIKDCLAWMRETGKI